MKKNKMMRIASILLVAVLISTCAIAGTFAKYVTTGSATDTARVAKFGVSVTAEGTTFAKTYKNADDNTGAADDAADDTITVKSDVKVVAPGTKGTLATVALAGQPEVDVQVDFALEAVKSDNWTVDNAEYFPLVFYVNGTKTDFDKLAKAVADLSFAVEAGTDLSTVLTTGEGADAKPVIEITWEWPFEADPSAEPNGDYKDTWLGNQAAAGNPATVTLTLTATVTQID